MNTHLKDISQWYLTYVSGFPVGEFDWLDFKDSRWLDLTPKCLDKLSEYVSAFANYGGGYLVIGIRDPKPGHAIETDEGVPLDIKNDLKSWLEDIIPNLTDPPVQRLNVHLVSDPTTQSPVAGHVLVVVHIQPSDAAPHQARDRKYYTRIGTKLSAVGHQAVLDILNRRRNPTVRTEVFVNINRHGGKHNVFWRVTNLSNVFARYVMSRIDVPIYIHYTYIKFSVDTMRVLDDGQTTVWPLIASNHLAQPLFPHGTIARQFEFEIACSSTGQPTLPFIRYRTFADHMEPVDGTIALDEAVNLTRDKTAAPTPACAVANRTAHEE